MKFNEFATLISRRMNKLNLENQLFVVDLDKNELWNLYLDSFDPADNPIHKERREHDCNCCKNFIRDMGAVVAIDGDDYKTLWDIDIKGPFAPVVKALSEFVSSHPIKGKFTVVKSKVGIISSLQPLENGGVHSWNHFHAVVDKKYVGLSPTVLGIHLTNKGVFTRGLKELTIPAIDSVLDLIASDSIYRGQEFLLPVERFRALKSAYDANPSDLFIWANTGHSSALIRNSAIGTLLVNLSDGVLLDVAVAKYEKIVAPENYKRPTAVITQSMIDSSIKTMEDLGIKDAIYRRPAVASDISINNVLFASREASAVMRDSISSLLSKEVKTSVNVSKDIEEISIADFIEKVVPNIDTMEVLFDRRHEENLMYLTAPEDESKGIFKWNNNFAWGYKGEAADSISTRVKKHGGNIVADVGVRLAWFNKDDLDLHVKEPNGISIGFNNKVSKESGGNLDVDMNVLSHGPKASRSAVENICWPLASKMPIGSYKIKVNNYTRRENIDVGFDIEVEIDGEVVSLHYDKGVRSGRTIEVATINKTPRGITLTPDKCMSKSAASVEHWGISTNQFQKVSMMTISPNHWDSNKIGNKHFFFILEKCKADEPQRGFYNEFLQSTFDKHRKVFEVLGSRLKCEPSNDQLSGLGFSVTKRNELTCKVSGTMNRTLKVLF